MKYIASLLKKHRVLVVIILVSSLLRSLFALANSWYSKYVFDGIAYGDINLRKVLFLGIFVTVWGAGSILLKNFSIDSLISKISYAIRNSFVRAILDSSAAKIKGLGEGRLLNDYSQDINAVAGLIRSGLDLLIIPFEMIISIVFLCFFNWKLAMVVIIVFPFILIIGRLIGNRIQDVSKKYLSQDDGNMKLLSRIVNGIEVIKVHCYMGNVSRNFENNTKNQLKLDIQRAKFSGIYSGITDFFMGLPFTIVYVFSAIMFSEGNMTVGTLTLFLQLLNKITVPFVAYSRIIMQFKGAKASVDRLKEVFDIEQRPEEEKRLVGFDQVMLKNVTFGYQEKDPVLERCTFSFEMNTYYGIVGANGSGKSTLCKLLMNLYSPLSGEVEYCGNPQKNNKLVYIEDKPVILFDSIVENVIGNQEYDAAKLARVLSETGLRTSSEDSIKDKKAEELSAGLLQRMIIARALYQLDQNDILFIDEGFSALDAATRVRMYELLKHYQKNLNLLVLDVSHNIDECERFDKIVTLTDGKINII